MESVTVTDILFTASVALLLSFLVAKFVSFALCHPQRDPHTATNNAHEHDDQIQTITLQSDTTVDFLNPIQVSRNVGSQNISVELWPVNSDIATSNVDVLTEESQSLGEKTTEVGSSAKAKHRRNTECVEEISIESSAQPVVREEIDLEDDDWEGIERSELE